MTKWLLVPVLLLAIAAFAAATGHEPWPLLIGTGAFLLTALSVVHLVSIPLSVRDGWLDRANDARRVSVAKAPQGYVALVGTAVSLGEPVRDPVTGERCAWFKVATYERKESGSSKLKEEASSQPIGLRDRSGICCVVPEGAEISISQGPESLFPESGIELCVWRIRPGDVLKVVGWMELDGDAREIDPDTIRRAAIAQHADTILTEWKSSLPSMLLRFDADKNGVLDGREWQSARDAATAEAERQLVAELSTLAAAARRVVRAPADGRPFLILDPTVRSDRQRSLRSIYHVTQGTDRLERGYLFKAVFAFLAAAGAVMALTYFVSGYSALAGFPIAPAWVAGTLAPAFLFLLLRSPYLYDRRMRLTAAGAAIFVFLLLLIAL